MFSYSRGPDIPLLNRTTGEQLEATALRFPDGLALVSCHQGERFTWSQLLHLADCLAGGLAQLGVIPGDRVGIWSTNRYEWVAMHMACARAGAVAISVNPAYRTHELAFVLRKSRMKALFLNERDERACYLDILNQARREPGIALRDAICFGSKEWRALEASAPAAPAPCAPADPTNIQYTSGTTGSPKGVVLTHRNLVNNGMLIARILRYTESDRICVPVPMSHCFGNVIATMASLASGAAMILPSATFQPRAVLEAIAAERATSLYGVPTMFIAELQHPDFASFDLTSLRTGVMAGAPCPVEIMKRVVREMHCAELTIGYGLTETAPIITMSEIDDDFERRVFTVGKAMPCTELKVVSLDRNEVVPCNIQGEICARGYMLMQGYDGEPRATERAIDSDGWFHTGDLGVMREDGYFKITGRAKDMIIRGGENIYPREIEEFLYANPKIAEVHVTGLPDERLGETVLAWIRLKPGESSTLAEVQEFCRDRIAHFKIPANVRFVDSFPTTVSGKIQKFRIREIEIEERGLADIARTETA